MPVTPSTSRDLSGQLHHMQNYLPDGILVVGMFRAAPENSVDNIASPGHLKRLKTEDIFVRGFNAVPFRRLVIVHDHGVNVQFNKFGRGHSQPPEKELQQQPAEKENSRQGKYLQKPFDGMERSPALGLDFNHGHTARVFARTSNQLRWRLVPSTRKQRTCLNNSAIGTHLPFLCMELNVRQCAGTDQSPKDSGQTG